MAVRPIPEGYHSVTPYMIVNNASAAIDFYKKAFGASELFRMPGKEGKIMHAEIKIGDSHVMMADETPEMAKWGAKSPQALGGSAIHLMIYCENVDQMFKQAISAGGTERMPVKDQFYGDRSGTLVDPYGHSWTISTHKEDLKPEEIEKRMKAQAPGQTC
jgi:PhnB protein